MRKNELYRAIDNLKPDSCLKSRISDAVESRDTIKAERRPVFIPIFMMLLICVNLGAMTIFFTGDKLNSNWQQTEMSSYEQPLNENTDDSSLMTMDEKADSFIEEINQNQYSYYTYYQSDPELVYSSYVWYKDHNIDNFNDTEVYYSGSNAEIDYLGSSPALYYSGIDVYRRYVQQVPQSVTGYSKSNVYTNHEYIVKYDGLGYERENIIYVLESAASFTKGDFFSGRTLDTEFDEWDEKGLDTDGCNIMYFVSEDEYVCMRELSDPDAANENPESWGRWIFHSDYGEEDAEQLYNITMSDENCWAAPDTGRCRIVPDIIGESGSQAEQILEQYGVTYKMVYPYGYNQYLSSNDAYVVKSLYPDSDVVSMNDVVRVYLEEK